MNLPDPQDIDLGQTPPGPSPDMAQPSDSSGGGNQAPIYPSVMLTGDEGLSQIPDEGQSMISHKVISRRVHTPQYGQHKGKKRHELEMHIKSIRPVKGKKSKPKSTPNKDETAMKKLMEE